MTTGGSPSPEPPLSGVDGSPFPVKKFNPFSNISGAPKYKPITTAAITITKTTAMISSKPFLFLELDFVAMLPPIIIILYALSFEQAKHPFGFSRQNVGV